MNAAASKPRIRLRAVPRGMNRQWVKCKTCGRVAYYDYVPYSLSNPIMTMPCGHGVGGRFHDAVTGLIADEAMPFFIEQCARGAIQRAEETR